MGKTKRFKTNPKISVRNFNDSGEGVSVILAVRASMLVPDEPDTFTTDAHFEYCQDETGEKSTLMSAEFARFAAITHNVMDESPILEPIKPMYRNWAITSKFLEQCAEFNIDISREDILFDLTDLDDAPFRPAFTDEDTSLAFMIADMYDDVFLLLEYRGDYYISHTSDQVVPISYTLVNLFKNYSRSSLVDRLREIFIAIRMHTDIVTCTLLGHKPSVSIGGMYCGDEGTLVLASQSNFIYSPE